MLRCLRHEVIIDYQPLNELSDFLEYSSQFNLQVEMDLEAKRGNAPDVQDPMHHRIFDTIPNTHDVSCLLPALKEVTPLNICSTVTMGLQDESTDRGNYQILRSAFGLILSHVEVIECVNN